MNRYISISFLVIIGIFFSSKGHIVDYAHRAMDALHKIKGITGPIECYPFQRSYIYFVRDNNEKYVVRFDDHAPKHLHTYMGTIQRYASERQIGPHIFLQDSESRLTVMEYLEHQLTPPEIHGKIPFLVSALKIMHATPLFDLKVDRFIDIVPRALLSFAEPDDKHLYEFHRKLITLQWIFDTMEDNVLIHGDLHPFNIFIKEDRCVFIDFESARIDNRFVDLAYIALLYGMSKEEEKTFLELYFARPLTITDFVKLTGMKCFVCAQLICWMIRSLQDSQAYYNKKLFITYVPPLREFLKDTINIENEQCRYDLIASSAKEAELLFKELEQCMLGNYSALAPQLTYCDLLNRSIPSTHSSVDAFIHKAKKLFCPFLKCNALDT